MDVRGFPGYLGFTSRGVIAVHMDWPTYPEEHGGDVALRNLGMFPEGTTFRQLDDCDGCVLFLAQVPGQKPPADPMTATGRHVAVWHEDLQELSEHGYVGGLAFGSRHTWEANRHTALLRAAAAQHGADVSDIRVGFMLPSGEWKEIEPPEPPDDDEWEVDASYPDWERSGDIVVTSSGFSHLQRLLALAADIPPRLVPRVRPLLDAKLYDIAVRELTLQLEVAMKRVLRVDGYHGDVVGEYARLLHRSGEFLTAWVRWHEVALRTAMKWVRNEFAHNVVDIEPLHTYALVGRLCELIATVEDVAGHLSTEAAPDPRM